MYQRILIATDGLPHSTGALRSGIGLAAQLRAELHLVYVRLPFDPMVLISYPMAVVDDTTRIAYEENSRAQAMKALSDPQSMAREAGLQAQLHMPVDQQAWQGILDTAAKIQADLIVMATHGRGSLKALLLGSQTHKLLTQTTVPVLVVR